jgi:methylmalonyl-CoA mutase cobalamin-binding subunit
MNRTEKEYLLSLVPKDLPDWRKIYEEGKARGAALKSGITRYCRENGYTNLVDIRTDKAKKGEIIWKVIMGLASVEDQIKGLRYLESLKEKNGAAIDEHMIIPGIQTAIPKELREPSAKGTSFVLEEAEDWVKIADATSIQPCFNDWHMGPNAVFTVENSIKVGSNYLGVYAQFVWDYPGVSDDVYHLSEVLKSLGMVAAKRADKFVVDTYLDDGIPSYFLDIASYLGFSRLEKYIVSDLCGARYACSFGQLMDKIIPKMAFWLAAAEVLKEPDQPGCGYIFSDCLSHWDHDLEANYGFLVPELLTMILVEKKYHTGIAILPIPITEKVEVPTPQGIGNIQTAAHRAVAKADELSDCFDFTPIEDMRDMIIEQGLKFFENILAGFTEAGIDIHNPLALMLVLKNMDPSKLEEFFHPRKASDGSVIPFIPTSMAQNCLAEKDKILTSVKEDTRYKKIMNMKFVMASGDAHWYGKFVVSGVLSGLGAEIVDGGVGLDPVDILDLADEAGVRDVCISLHNGQALNYSREITQLASKRANSYNFYVGGVLNSILEGDETPSDVTDMIEQLGVHTAGTVEELLLKLIEK